MQTLSSPFNEEYNGAILLELQPTYKVVRTHAFIERALDRMPKGTKGGEELAELIGKGRVCIDDS